MDIKFNTKQKSAYKKLNEFIDQDVNNKFYLFGPAGTGKSVIISKIIIELLERKIIDYAYLTAPTHCALNILEKYFKTNYKDDNQKILNKIKFMTIHKLLEYKASISNETGDKIFKSEKESTYLKSKQKRLIIIDECSMLSSTIVKDIDKYIELYSLKVIYLGDQMQLRPVNSDSKSLIFTSIPEKYPFHITLTEIMRTKSPSIKNISQIIREWNSKDKSISIINQCIPEHELKMIPFRLYHKKDDYVATTWFKYVVEKIKENTVPIILTWRNASAKYYNQIIREHIHKTKKLSNYMVNDCLMFNGFYASPEIDNIPSVRFYTSNVIKINEVVSEKKLLIDWNDIKLKNINKIPSSVLTAYYKLIKKLSNFPSEFIVDTFSAVKIHNNPDDLDINQLCIVKTINLSEISEYTELIKSIKTQLEFFFAKYKSEEISSALWKKFHQKLIDPYAELNFGYSITTHKAQGSTYEIVLVDFEDIKRNPNVPEMHEAFYTATTRASKELRFLI